MLSNELLQDIENCNQRDIVRLYLFISEKYKTLKEEDPKQLSRTLYAVKNMGKMKECVVRARDKVKMNKAEPTVK